MNYFNRYTYFEPGEIIPFIPISISNTDKYEIYTQGITTLDSLSYKYYGSSLMGWVISTGNPDLPINEFDYEDGKVLRIPFPLSRVKKEYEEKVNNYKTI
jgi:hypothetical protein